MFDWLPFVRRSADADHVDAQVRRLMRDAGVIVQKAQDQQLAIEAVVERMQSERGKGHV